MGFPFHRDTHRLRTSLTDKERELMAASVREAMYFERHYPMTKGEREKFIGMYDDKPPLCKL